jgi:A/G-specific adenine glycosylase
MQISDKKIKTFQKEILTWYKNHQRDLPWRKTRDPYCILISEVMSQQTQLSRVVPKYEAWIAIFPTVHDLAKANISEVLKYWSGLGYNRRALNLKRAAEKISEQYDNVFPNTEKELISLPGIGTYTARAVLCFAFDEQIAVVDTNVRKVILTQILNRHSRERSDSGILQLADSERIAPFAGMTEKEFEEIATQLLPHGMAYEWNQALMDYAAMVLKKEKIAIPKQSKYVGSHRYYRSKVLKILLEKNKVKVDEIGEFLKNDYTLAEKDWLEKLLKELEKEGFISIDGQDVFLSS